MKDQTALNRHAMNDYEPMGERGNQSHLLQRFRDHAAPVLAGEESVEAAQHLEAFVLNELPDGADTDNLLESLALYAPGAGEPYVEPEELRRIVAAALARAEGDVA